MVADSRTEGGISLRVGDFRYLGWNCYTYRDCFATAIEDIKTIDLIEDHSLLLPGPIPTKAQPRWQNRRDREAAQDFMPSVERANAAQALEKICDCIQHNATRVADSGKQFHLATDASETGTGGVLLQPDDAEVEREITESNFSKSHVIMWISERFNDAERRYTILEKEMAAVVRGLKECE
ncbi:hypothetical protein FSARC_8815 [Fusarium sarcochroum]|uniref:Reverse transcriptase RNase H-like domain-containing protein n=1 Tax=Fusarium sarcochroum TaxID=1208366 RepID=A0A8H4TSB1_9HYPO|nr:hypothetical protein FSARC_8815 [Fusarium sarcochroum]